MSRIDVMLVDERDCGWEDHRPRFRVYLHGSGSDSTGGWTMTHDIVGADVVQVIVWAQRQAGDSRTYAVALVYDDELKEQSDPGYGQGLVWLVGMDGNDYDPDNPHVATTQQRMLQRRIAPIQVPEADRMPAEVPSASREIVARLDEAQDPRG